MMPRTWLFPIIGLLVCACVAPNPQSEPPRLPHTAALAMPDEFSAQVAGEVMRIGGNAVDAAVAGAFALAVTYPEAGNIGGGGMMLLYVDGQARLLDYSSAPAGGDDGSPVETRQGHRSVAVPGTVAGLWAAHYQYGLLTWDEVLAPAIRLAEAGFVAPSLLVQRIESAAIRFPARTGFNDYFSRLREGDLVRQPELAETLERIARDGPDGFYTGRTGRLIEAEMRRGGGRVSGPDLAAYQPIWREPLTSSWREYELITAAPPSVAGVGLIQLLKMKDYRADEFFGLEHNSAGYIDLLAQLEWAMVEDRNQWDPRLDPDRAGELIDNDYLFRRAAGAGTAGQVTGTGPDSETGAVFSIVDRYGNAVANSTTLHGSFGSGVVVKGAGFLLNNSNQPHALGRILLAPTLLTRNDEVNLVIGSPGGQTSVGSIFQTLINLIDFGMALPDALAASRIHSGTPNQLTFSPSRPLPPATQSQLQQRGYRVDPHGHDFGDLQVVRYQGDNYAAASDPRSRGVARVMPW